MIFLKILYQNYYFLGNGRLIRIRSLQCYEVLSILDEVLWIYVIDTICTFIVRFRVPMLNFTVSLCSMNHTTRTIYSPHAYLQCFFSKWLILLVWFILHFNYSLQDSNYDYSRASCKSQVKNELLAQELLGCSFHSQNGMIRCSPEQSAIFYRSFIDSNKTSINRINVTKISDKAGLQDRYDKECLQDCIQDRSVALPYILIVVSGSYRQHTTLDRRCKKSPFHRKDCWIFLYEYLKNQMII